MVAEQGWELFGDRQALLQRPLLDHGARQHGDDAHHRADLHRDDVPIGGDKTVVEKAVDVIPHPLAVHGVADSGEVLDKLEHQVLRRTVADAVRGRPR